MTTEEVEDYSSISLINICFADSIILSDQFDQAYSRQLYDLDDFFTTGRKQVHTKSLERLQTIIYATILDDEQTLGDPAHIQSILDKNLQLRV